MQGDPFAATIAAEPSSNVERPVIGDRYEILGLLGTGGMGTVYKARDRELDELLAVKILRAERVEAPDALERFRREVKLARRVTHPNVARVYDIGEQGGQKLLTMELVDGEPLSALLEREGALRTDRAVEIARAVCAGVAAAHAAGVVHRDLKPDNILLARDGRVVVTDFGIARAAAGDAAVTAAGGFVGTPAYMAPEQVEGGVVIDERADVYAFGAVLFELVTGERAFRGDTPVAVAAARLLHAPPDPRDKRHDLPVALASLIRQCMARRPADRYPSMGAVGADLASVTLPAPAAAARPRRAASEALAPAASGKRVAVLPFANLGPPEHDYIADGLTDELIDQLSMAQGLRVRSRGTVMRFKGRDRDPLELGRELDVQVIVEGSVRKGPGSVRIHARVVSVDDGFQIWAKRFDGTECEVLAQSDEVARAVAEALTVDAPRPPREAARDAEAVDLYLRARASYHAGFPTGFAASIPIFEEALARAPDDPRILAGFAMARARAWSGDAASQKTTRELVERALALAPSLPDAHVALGVMLIEAGDHAGAVRPLRRALRLSPAHAEAHESLGRVLAEAGRDEGLRHLETALALEPGFDNARVCLACAYALRGEWKLATALLEDPNDGRPVLHTVWARLLLWRPDRERAARLLDSLPADRPGLFTRALLELTISGKPPWEFVPPGDRLSRTKRVSFALMEAEVSCILGDAPRALTALARGDAEHLINVDELDRCPLFDRLRADPAFVMVRAHAAERAARAVAEYLASEDSQ